MPTRIHFQDDSHERLYKSLCIIGAISFGFFILFIRIFFIQVIQADINKRLSEENQMQLNRIKAPRGLILDRNGVVLARNRPSYSICILPYKMDKKAGVVSNLLKIRDKYGLPIFDSLTLVKRIKKAKYRRFDATSLKEDISIDLVSVIEEHSMELPGIIVETEARREYPLGPASFHVLGYMSEIPETIFDSLKEIGYFYGDKIGKSGIEKQYEELFHGKDGIEYIEVNAYGRSLGPIEHMPRIDPIPGYNLYLNIDARIQEQTYVAFPDTLKGAVVVLNPQNGEILAMYSNPSVDPNIFSLAATLRAQSWAQTALDPNLPLNNRAISGEYPPGSTFKLVSGLAGVDSKNVSSNVYMNRSCSGAFRFGTRVAHCWKLSGHGKLKLRDAIKVSCNIYFYQLGLLTGDKIINSYARTLSLGMMTGIDLPNEKKGWLSGEEAHNERHKSKIARGLHGWKWTRGLLLDLAIGQAQVITPLQMALMVGGLGNGNYLYKPFVMKEQRAMDGTVIKQNRPEILNTFYFDTASINVIKHAMEDVIIKPGGTGRRARVPGIRVGGKSGSAENPHGEKTHGVFIACAPMEKPVIAVAAVVENAGHGGTVAAPIVGHILRYFFSETEEGKNLTALYSPKKKE
jgi:penicillin-binding protein 2